MLLLLLQLLLLSFLCRGGGGTDMRNSVLVGVVARGGLQVQLHGSETMGCSGLDVPDST